MRQKISGIVPTYNEENKIEDCLKSLDWVDELIVVDSFSTDNTLAIVKKYADKVIQHKYNYSASQKNWIIPQTKYEWIILVDADERVPEELKEEILKVLEQPSKKAYWIYRDNFFLGKRIKHCGWNEDKVVRLFTKDHRYEDVKVHAEIITNKKETGVLKAKLVHYPYENIGDYFVKLRRYSKWSAEKSFVKGKRTTVFHIFFIAPLVFLKKYIVLAGFLDGFHGLILSLFASISALMKYIKLWELQKIPQGRKR